MTRVVLDTNVVVSGLFWDGSPDVFMRSALAGEIELVTSAPLLAELPRVLRRSKFAAKVAGTGIGVDQLVNRYAALATVLVPGPIRRIVADPDDDVVFATAAAANQAASAFVSSGYRR